MAFKEEVRAHALAKYNSDGWDYIYEAFDDAELDELLKDAKDLPDAIRIAGERAKLLDDRRKDVMAEIF